MNKTYKIELLGDTGDPACFWHLSDSSITDDESAINALIKIQPWVKKHRGNLRVSS